MTNPTTVKKVNEILVDVKSGWRNVSQLTTVKLDRLKEVLVKWSEYVDSMEDLIMWLRKSEKIVKQPLTKITVDDVTEHLIVLQVRDKYKIKNENYHSIT